MTNEIKTFCGMGFETRITTMDGNPWFVAKDVCDALNHSNYRMAVNDIDEDEKDVSTVDTLGGPQKMIIINESGLYSLIIKSRKPEAKKFKKWITSDVLPSIRKDGGYLHTNEDDDESTIMAKAILLAQGTIKKLENKVEQAKPALNFHDVATNGQTQWTITTAAKELGMSLNDLRSKLIAAGCLKKIKRGIDGYRYWPNKVFYDKGIVSYCEYEKINGSVSGNYAFTKKGMNWIRCLLKYGEPYAKESVGIQDDSDHCQMFEDRNMLTQPTRMDESKNVIHDDTFSTDIAVASFGVATAINVSGYCDESLIGEICKFLGCDESYVHNAIDYLCKSYIITNNNGKLVESYVPISSDALDWAMSEAENEKYNKKYRSWEEVVLVHGGEEKELIKAIFHLIVADKIQFETKKEEQLVRLYSTPKSTKYYNEQKANRYFAKLDSSVQKRAFSYVLEHGPTFEPDYKEMATYCGCGKTYPYHILLKFEKARIINRRTDYSGKSLRKMVNVII